MEVKDMFQNYSISLAERVPILKKNWLGRQGLQLIETLTQALQEACNVSLKNSVTNLNCNTMILYNHYKQLQNAVINK